MELSDSLPSSSRFNISSGLLPAVDAPVFRLAGWAPFVCTGGGVLSGLAEVFRVSHEKGPPSFRGGGRDAATVVFEEADGGGGGGGAKGTVGRLPERPFIRGGGLGG